MATKKQSAIPDQSLPVDEIDLEGPTRFEDPVMEELDEADLHAANPEVSFPEIEALRGQDPKTHGVIVGMVKQILNQLAPGLVALGKKHAPKPKPKPFMYTERFAQYMEKHKSDEKAIKMVTLVMRPNGELGGQYHSKLFHINQPGVFRGSVPLSIAVKLAEDHPKDFAWKEA